MQNDILELINDYLNRSSTTTTETDIMRRAAIEIQSLRKDYNHLMTQFINMGNTNEKPNRSSKQSKPVGRTRKSPTR